MNKIIMFTVAGVLSVAMGTSVFVSDSLNRKAGMAAEDNAATTGYTTPDADVSTGSCTFTDENQNGYCDSEEMYHHDEHHSDVNYEKICNKEGCSVHGSTCIEDAGRTHHYERQCHGGHH